MEAHPAVRLLSEEAVMTTSSVGVLDRATGRVIRLRAHTEPVKLRVCRACGRAHGVESALCRPAA